MAKDDILLVTCNLQKIVARLSVKISTQFHPSCLFTYLFASWFGWLIDFYHLGDDLDSCRLQSSLHVSPLKVEFCKCDTLNRRAIRWECLIKREKAKTDNKEKMSVKTIHSYEFIRISFRARSNIKSTEWSKVKSGNTSRWTATCNCPFARSNESQPK